MRYKKFSNTNWEASILGFGCMRLPVNESFKEMGGIDVQESIRMIRYAIDKGVNYIDTAYPYHGGFSEIVVGEALKDGYREKVKLATKSPTWSLNSASDFDKYLDEQLKKLQTDKIDFYLFHALNKSRWYNIILKNKILERAEKAKTDGRISQIGFSFHDHFNTFKEIIEGYDNWEFCQIQFNYLDLKNQAGLEGLKLAGSKGISVVIMEPLLGGRLANPPIAIRQLFDNYTLKRSYSEWALQWLWHQPDVSVVLSGMSNFNQVKENIISASKEYEAFGDAELQLIEEVRQKYYDTNPIPCNACGYCMPCPNGVNITRNFQLYNESFIHNDLNTPSLNYTLFFPANERADNCIECRECEEKCPQNIEISKIMPLVHKTMLK